MKRTNIMQSLTVFLACMLSMLAMGCSDYDLDDSSLSMDGDNFITSFSINGQEGTIDNVNKTIVVYLPQGTDLTSLTPTFTLSEGATSNITSGSTVNFTMPVVFKVINGNTYIDYTVTVKCYEASVTSFAVTALSGTKYTGTIDNDNHAINVYLEAGTEVTRLTVSYTLSEGAEASISNGSVIDFTNPVEMTVSNHGSEATYTITVFATDMPVTAFIGTAATVDGLKDEEKAAAEWMLSNVPRSEYISMQDLISGAVTLDPSTVKAIWWHCDDNSWPSQGWDSRDAIKNYYAAGGSLLLSRYASKYINDVYQIALDQKEPNLNTRYDVAQTLTSPLGFTVDDASHPIFDGMNAESGSPIYLIDAGCSTTNCLVVWNLWDYSDAHSLEAWENGTGGKRLAYESDDSNKTAIVEFPARTATAGKCICIGTGGFEWNISNDASNQYSENRKALTLNVLYYLVGMN